MHDKFTERVRKVMFLAREEAARLQHDYIGTEHLLLGIIREGEGIAATVLHNLGLDLDAIRQAVENMVAASGGTLTIGEIPFTPRAKRVLELSVDEARQLGHNYVGTEHLLLGLIREGEGVAARVLHRARRGPQEGARGDAQAPGRRPGRRAAQEREEQAGDAGPEPVRPRPDPAGERRASSTRSSAASSEIERVIQVLSPPQEEQPGPDRRAGRRQDRDRRGAGAADRREPGARSCCATSGSSPSTWPRWSPAPSTAASSRSG